jgi:hypothetical protein
VISAFFELCAGILEILLGPLFRRLFPRRKARAGPVERAELPPSSVQAIVAALKAEEDPARLLPRGWQGFQSGLSRQAEPDLIVKAPIGAELPLAIEPNDRRDKDEVRVSIDLPDRSTASLGHLPADEAFIRALERGLVRCWFAARRPTLRHELGAAIVFVAIYDP